MNPQNIIWAYITRDQLGYSLQGQVDCPFLSDLPTSPPTPTGGERPPPPPPRPTQTEERGGTSLERWGRASSGAGSFLFSSCALGFSRIGGLSLASSELP